MPDLISQLGLDDDVAELQWVWEGLVVLTLLAIGTLYLRNRRTRSKITWIASGAWLGLFAIVYLFSWIRYGFNRLSWKWYFHLFSVVLPGWLVAGLVILWVSYGIRLWIDSDGPMPAKGDPARRLVLAARALIFGGVMLIVGGVVALVWAIVAWSHTSDDPASAYAAMVALVTTIATLPLGTLGVRGGRQLRVRALPTARRIDAA